MYFFYYSCITNKAGWVVEHLLQVELIFKYFGWKISLDFFRLHLFLLLWRNITPELFITSPPNRGSSWILQCFPTVGNFNWVWLLKNWQRLNLSSHLRQVKRAAVTQALGWTSLKLSASCLWPRSFLFRGGASFQAPCPIHCLILRWGGVDRARALCLHTSWAHSTQRNVAPQCLQICFTAPMEMWEHYLSPSCRQGECFSLFSAAMWDSRWERSGSPRGP